MARSTVQRVHRCIVAFGLLLPIAACGANTPAPSPVTGVAASPVPNTLSGQVFEVLPGRRIPAAGIPLLVVVVTTSSCSPPCIFRRTTHREETTTGPDGRYRFPDLPPGSALIQTLSRAHHQVCGASAALTAATTLDVEITSATNPQPSPTSPPLRISGQIYEMTPEGRVGLDGASIYMEWMLNDLPFHEVHAGKDGRYSACGIPANSHVAFWTFKTGYHDPYVWHQFSRDTVVDIELQRE